MTPNKSPKAHTTHHAELLPHDSDCGIYNDPREDCDCSVLVREAYAVASKEPGCIIQQLAFALEKALNVIHTRRARAAIKKARGET